MSVYTIRFFCGPVTANGSLLATVPAGMKWILIDLELLNTGGGAGSVGAYIQPVSGGAATVVRINNVQLNDHAQWQGRVALNAGDQLFGLVSTGAMQAIATGYEFLA